MPSVRTLPHDLRMFAKYHLKRRVVDYPAPETEMGVVSLGFDLDAYVDDLRRRKDRFDIEQLAEVSYAGRKHPVLWLRSRAPAARKCLLVLAGVHGNERAGLVAVPQFLDQFDSDAVRLSVIAPVNPVGAAELSRYNADGYDINRDFVRFDTVEARAVRRVFRMERPDFVISLHEGPQDATFMFTNRFVRDDSAKRILVDIERGGTELATRDYFGRRLHPAGLAPMGRISWTLSWLWAATLQMKPMGMWANDHGVPEITIESSWRQPDRDARVRPHVDVVRAVSRELSR